VHPDRPLVVEHAERLGALPVRHPPMFGDFADLPDRSGAYENIDRIFADAFELFE
jgi:hypothetical protein